MISTARTSSEKLIYVGGVGPKPSSWLESGDVQAKKVKDAIIEAGGRPEHVLYHDQYMPGQVIFTCYVPQENLVKFIHALDGDKRIKTIKRALAWVESRKHIMENVKHWANQPAGSRNGYKVLARSSNEPDPKIPGTLVIVLPINTIKPTINATRDLKIALAKVLERAEIDDFELRGSFARGIGIASVTINQVQLREIEKAAHYFYRKSRVVFNEDEQAAIDSVKDKILSHTLADVRQFGVSKSHRSVRASRVLNLIEARFAEEKSIYPIKAVLRIWQNRQNKNVTWNELRSFLESNFTDYKILGLAATGTQHPVFGEDFVLFEATMNEQQAQNWLRSRGSSYAGDEREDHIKGYFDNDTAENKRWMSGKFVAPSGKKVAFVKYPSKGHNDVNGA
jgi:hypothetical protein